MSLSNEFRRLANRFRRLAETGTDSHGPDEARSAGARGYILLKRSLEEDLIPYFGGKVLTLQTIRVENFEDGIKADLIRSVVWDAAVQKLCSMVPDECGLPRNPSLWQKDPTGENLDYDFSKMKFRSYAENMATVCDWLGSNVVDTETNESTDQVLEDTIVTDGEGLYWIGDFPAVKITGDQDEILRAFLERPALTKSELTKQTEISRPNEVLKRIAKNYNGIFSPAITFPGAKGNGGYRVKIVRR